MQGTISVFQQAAQRELLQDFQDYLFGHFQRPSLILIPQHDGSLYSCFPRKREPLPYELFHYLMHLASNSLHRFPIEKEENAYTRTCFAAGKSRSVGHWGWHTSSLGLTDFYFPLSLPTPGPQSQPVAVLVFGKYLCESRSAPPELHSWIDRIVHHYRSVNWSTPGSPSGQDFLQISPRLHELANKIPIIDSIERAAIEKDLLSAIALAQVFLQRTLNVESFFRDGRALDDLGLGQPDLHITSGRLWKTVEEALKRLCKTLPLSSAVVYSARYRDTIEMKLVATVPRSLSTPAELPLASNAEFAWLQTQSWVNVPNAGEFFGWLDPERILGSRRGLLFGREMIGGNLILLGFGQSSEGLPPPARALLYDAVNSQIFRFIDNAMFGIEMDHLMAETGHLMGRAVGKISLGVGTLLRVLPQDLPSLKDNQRYQGALWAIEDGETHLELIRQNFYAFQTRRRKGDPDHAEVEHDDSHYAVFPVVAVINEMRGFFDRAAEEGDRKPIVYLMTESPTFVRGDRNAMRLTLLNLFDNALKFSYANTYFTLMVASKPPDCTIAIVNLGVGVAQNETANVFRAFTKSRFRNPYKRIEGLGLGLPYCRWVVEEIFKGTIRLTSSQAKTPKKTRFEGDNWLTTVTITLPLTSPPGEQE